MKKNVKVMLLCVTFGALFACSDGDFDDSGTNSSSNNSGNAFVSPEAIDLGLPSGIKWANFNVGATKPEEYGGYYAWGETEEKSSYHQSNYLYYKNGSYIGIGYNISATQYDVAHIKLGGTWRMPTRNELSELLNECTWVWTTLNSVNGYLVTGSNGNSIFLPATGFYNGDEVVSTTTSACYRSSTLLKITSFEPNSLFFNSKNFEWDWNNYYGYSVRPVCE